MRFGGSWVLWWPLATTLVGCSGSFGVGQDADGGEGDATEENPRVEGIGSDSGGAHDGTSSDGGHSDATSAADTGTTAAEGGVVAEAAVADASDDGPPAGCPTGDLSCSGTCVPDDVHNCGTCGHDCTNLAHVAGATTCTATGQCSFPESACAAGWAQCNTDPDDGCETDITKPSSCGSCTNACPTNDPVCSGGTCVSGCTGTQVLCSGACVDTTSNASDCNGCGLACPDDVTNAQPTCANSQCTFTCNSSFTGCPTAAPTACVNEATDPGNCGGCNTTCPGPTSGTGTPACAAGSCTLDCATGLTACPATGIPTECANTTTDLGNCGTCGDVCKTTVPDASPTCIASTCGFACNSGYQLCNSSSCVPLVDGVNGVFVSSLSGSGTACTETSPCASIDTAIGVAVGGSKTIIYIDKGTYGTEVVTLPTNAAGITIQGGWTYSGGSWTQCNDGTDGTSIISAPAGSYVGISGTAGTWKLDTLSIQENNTPPASASQGQTTYGVFVAGGSLTLQNVAIQVAAGGAGGGGSQGTAGAATGGGCAPAGTGGVGGNGNAGGAAAVGAYAPTGFAPGTGLTGTSGGAGQPGGQPATPACVPYTDLCCTGTPPSCTSSSCGASCCAGAGKIGCGGGGSGPGSGGYGGGASLGVFVGGGTVTFGTGVAITTASGGAGGAGGPGGTVGGGTLGTTGAAGEKATACGEVTNGGGAKVCGATEFGEACAGSAGSQGGAGGPGGQGGGGAGGDSYCYATPSGGTTATGVTCNHGSGGAGGNQGSANQGATGNAG